MTDWYDAPMSGYDMAPIHPADHGRAWDETHFGGMYGATAYERDVVEALRGQGVLNDRQAEALLQGIGQVQQGWNQAASGRPMSATWDPQAGLQIQPAPEPVGWVEATALVGGAFAGGWLLASLLERLF